MRNKIIVFFLLFISFCACKQSKTGVLITGKIKNSASNVLFFRIGDRNDTVKIDNNGTFEYQVSIQNPEFLRIIVPQTQKKVLLLVDTLDQINVSFDAQNPDSTAIIQGSKGTALIKEIQEQFIISIQKMQAIDQRFQIEKRMATKETYNGIRQKAIDSLKSTIDTEIAYLQSFIEKNSSSLASITALYQTFDNETGRPLLLDVPKGITLFIKVDSTLRMKYKSSMTVQNFHQAVVALKMSEAKNIYDARKSPEKPLLKIGDVSPDFEIQNIEGKKCRLSIFHGKVVLLDFWASWCPPCRALNPQLVKIFENYHAKGFEIFQISLDKKLDQLQAAIKQDKLPWKTQGCDYKSWESPIAKQYFVHEIPQNFLLDKQGKIIAINCNSVSLEEVLRKILR